MMKWFFRLIFKKKIAELESAINQANSLRHESKIEYVSFEPQNHNSPFFYRKIMEIAGEKCFISWICATKQKYQAELIDPRTPIEDRAIYIGRIQALQGLIDDVQDMKDKLTAQAIIENAKQ